MFFCISTTLSSSNATIMGLVCCVLAGEGCGNSQTYCPSFVAIRLFVGLFLFTPGTQLSIYVLLIPIISEHWTDLSATSWL